ncbi:VWA domain-containing protein [Streptomyces phaeochromogenes]|uniref:VWA domain-containing protein n=1 Tax=Streptomyces phaeochromogenes TaxID=1923 RepID=UPI0033CD6F4A
MGILTRLRNAFGKSRKGDAAAAAATPAAEPSVPAARQETAPEPVPTAAEPSSPAEPAATVPAPATEPKASVVEDLVSAAFDNVTVPKQASPTAEQETKAEPKEKAKAKPVAKAKPAAEPVVEAEPVAKPTAAAEPVAEPEPVAKAEPVIGTEPETKAEPVVAAEAEPVVEAKAEPVVEAEPVVDAKAEAEAVVEPEAEVKPEPVVEADADADAETEAAVKAEPVVEAESESKVEAKPAVKAKPVAEAEPAVEAEPVLEAEPVVEAEPQPEPVVADVTPEPEPVVEPESVVAEAVPEPELVVAEVTPEAEPVTVQADEPAVADDESVTSGAGGKTGGDEGEAESEGTAPATTLTQVKAHAPGLLTAYNAAASTLEKHDLSGTRAKVYLVLDRSASMRPYYKDGSAQALGEQTLALAAHLDPTATVHVVFFSTELDGTGELALPDHENKIDELHAGLGRMGRTSYHAAVQEVLTHHEKSDAPTGPALVIFQTDGAPDAKTPATQSLTDAAKNHPGVFFSFVAFGEQDNKAFDYLRKLKTDNTAFFHAGPTPRELTDTEVYEGVLANWRP